MCKQTNTNVGPCTGLFAHIIRLHSNKGNKTQLPQDIYETDIIWWCNHLGHTTTEKYDNNGKGWWCVYCLCALLHVIIVHYLHFRCYVSNVSKFRNCIWVKHKNRYIVEPDWGISLFASHSPYKIMLVKKDHLFWGIQRFANKPLI